MSDERRLRDADFSQLEGEGVAAAQVSENSDAAMAGPDIDSSGAGSQEISKLKADLADTKDKYLRTLADLENFRKRTIKERSELIKYQGEPILVDILEVLDSFERALETPGADIEKFKEGISLIHKQFVAALGKWEVRADSSIDKEFDPNRQRAIGKAKVPGKAANVVIGELKKAYLYKDRLIRFGEVMVAEGEAETPSDSQEEAGS